MEKGIDSDEMVSYEIDQQCLQGSTFRWYMLVKQKYSLKKGIGLLKSDEIVSLKKCYKKK